MGLFEAEKPPDGRYAFGHMQKKYLWNLWSAIGLFSIGCGLGLAHAWHSLHQPHEVIESVQLLGWSVSPVVLGLSVLGIGLVLEGYSCFVAIREYLIMMRNDGWENPVSYIWRCNDVTLVAVVLEDVVAVLGLIFAALGISLTAVTGNVLWDIGFSVGIALMLGAIAFFLGAVNMRFLADARDPEAERVFAEIVQEHPEIHRHHDVRSIVLDERHTVLVAEIELREEAIVPAMSERIDGHEQSLLESVPGKRRDEPELNAYVRARASVQATLERTEEIINELESELRARAPQVDHATIEVEGIVSSVQNDGA
jgi:zinc transporter 9